MEDNSLLGNINSPHDLKALDEEQLPRLCREIRRFLVDTVSRTGGHLASNLGAVELTVALHRVFDTPLDQIVWDVGHQSYTHKLLTGRRDAFATLRQENGLSGFPKSRESMHDAFLGGHSSTSLAVAEGLARAKRFKGEPGRVIAIIGDGAFTGGMAFEGLNNAVREGENLIIILNDNEMSIGKNVGGLSAYLTKLRTNKSYFKLKDMTKSALRSIPVVGDSMVEMVSSSKSHLKSAVYGTSFFEEFGLVHLGPVNGHNLRMLCDVLERAKNLDGPIFIHVETKKGKGYPFAEKNPGAYHGVSRFDPKEGNGGGLPAKGFSSVFGRTIAAMAHKDERICAVTAAMKYGTGLNHFSEQFRSESRFVDVGIAEQQAVTFSAGLAAGGMIPVFGVYSTFLQRAYDQLIHDCALEPRHVVLGVDRAGLVGEDGETHQGIFDCAFLSTVPGSVIYSPSTYRELRRCLYQAVYENTGVAAVRYPRGQRPALPDFAASTDGNYDHMAGDGSLLIVTYGRQWAEVCWAVDELRGRGDDPGVLKLTRVHPIPQDAWEIAFRYDRILFVEEGIRLGGIGEHFVADLAQRGYPGRCRIQAIEDSVVPQGSIRSQLKWLGLDRGSIASLARKLVSERVSI